MTKLSNTFEEVQLVYTNRTLSADRPSVTRPDDAYNILLQSWNQGQLQLIEESKLLLIDRLAKLMSVAQISKGGMDSAITDPRIVFSIALKRRAHQIILAHNHPSGNLLPSKADIMLTKRLGMAGVILGIPLLDHLIVTPDGYTALITEGYVEKFTLENALLALLHDN